jgi:hypothetical protein
VSAQDLIHGVENAVDELDEQVLLAIEITVKSGPGYVCFLKDILNRTSMESLARENANARIHDIGSLVPSRQDDIPLSLLCGKDIFSYIFLKYCMNCQSASKIAAQPYVMLMGI